MKRFLCLAFAILLALGLPACNSSEETAEAPAWAGKFAIGFGRADATPNYSVVMKGYTAAGQATRMSESILSNVFITCIAMTDEADNTVLLFTYDCIMLHDGPALTPASPWRTSSSAPPIVTPPPITRGLI